MVTVEPVEEVAPLEPTGLVAALNSRLDEVAERWVSHIVAKNSGYLDNALISLPDLRRTCRDNAAAVLRLLAGEPTAGGDPLGVVRASARRAAERGIPLDSLLRSYRLGGLALWEELAVCAPRSDRELVDVASALWLIIDEVSAEFATCYHYHRTELELLRMAEQRRRVMVDELLRGRGREGGFAEEAAVKLDLPADSAYLVVAVEPTPTGRPGVEMPAETLTAGGFRSVWQVSGELLVGLVALERSTPDAALRRLRPAMRGRGGVGPVVTGLGQVDEGHQLAAVALATLPAGKPGLATLEDHLPEALLVRSPDLGEMLVRELLGPVLDLPGKEGTYLLTTLAVWIDTNCSVAHTATRLYCHRNTVLNRLNRLEGLLGRPLKGRATFVAVSLALTAWELGLRGEGRPR
ncbi:helix-turn-helix domain-containing protein [Actinophytocola sp.]|uniref:PucR family transcriptional regulator n=1 Tax=Actinophytocola sp. TaxID=1872138 RepID=UPI002D7E6AD8|nr:helix-turn-helix domain-containing protein [Actinophytocola sp.]HET9138364.1 helix-turn-helix domain-containing protein [Actinophytocola sp.]